jgi:hypothetical protein
MVYVYITCMSAEQLHCMQTIQIETRQLRVLKYQSLGDAVRQFN